MRDVPVLHEDQTRHNRYMEVIEVASKLKADNKPLHRTSLAEEFFRENPMPWLLDADPIDEPKEQKRPA